jgi:hypothetical protein
MLAPARLFEDARAAPELIAYNSSYAGKYQPDPKVLHMFTAEVPVAPVMAVVLARPFLSERAPE